VSDNFQTDASAGDGKTFASDEVVGGPTGGTCDYPLSKLAFGPLDAATIVDDAAGARFPVKVSDGLGAAAVLSGQISLSGAESALSAAVARRFKLKAHVDNTDVVYVGTTGVTTSSGYPLWPGDPMDVEVSNLNVVHAIVGSGTQKLSYLGFV
jgi:hypothetical protein